MLGLHATHLCGIEIAASVWEAAANHLLASQSAGGTKVELHVLDYRTQALMRAQLDGSISQARSFSHANGWNYKEPKSEGEWTPTWGSMTCAGIRGLAICQAALQDYPAVKRLKLQSEMVRGRDDGFAWLAKFMTQRCHPGAIERQQRFFYYYLNSLERAAMLANVALIQ